MKKIAYVDMDDTICHYTDAMYKQLTPSLKYPQSQLGFYLALKPMEGAIEGVNALINSGLYDVYILTAPSIMNAHSYSEKRLWIEQHFGIELCHKLILSPNKGLLKGDYLIDDISFGKGQENFDGKLIQIGTAAFPGWDSIIEYMLGYMLPKTLYQNYTFSQMKEEIQ